MSLSRENLAIRGTGTHLELTTSTWFFILLKSRNIKYITFFTITFKLKAIQKFGFRRGSHLGDTSTINTKCFDNFKTVV